MRDASGQRGVSDRAKRRVDSAGRAPVIANAKQPSACDVCRSAAYSKGPELVEIAAARDQPDFLYRCRSCGTYWEFDIHDGHQITKEEAMNAFPQAFAAADNGRNAPD
jgi:hypothetical protein